MRPQFALILCAAAVAAVACVGLAPAEAGELRPAELEELRELVRQQQAVLDRLNERIARLEAQADAGAEPGAPAPLDAPTLKSIRRLAELADNVKFKGDLTLRQSSAWRHRTGGPRPDRHRQQVRFRLGGEYAFNDRTTIGARLVTGAGDPSSNWQTFNNTFGGKDVFLDRIYVKYVAADWLNLVAGKFKNIFRNTDLIWDSDVQPEGAAQSVVLGLTQDADFFAHLGELIIGELANDHNDPFVWAAEAGVRWRRSPKLEWMASAIYYDFTNLDEAALAWNDSGNTRLPGNILRHDFNLLAFYTELKTNRAPKPLKVYAEYVNNTSGAPDDEGYKVGAVLGSNKKKGDWSVGYAYRVLEGDAVPDMLTDGTFHEGGTNCKGHEAILKYSLAKGWTISLKGIAAREETGDTDEVNSVLAELRWDF